MDEGNRHNCIVINVIKFDELRAFEFVSSAPYYWCRSNLLDLFSLFIYLLYARNKQKYKDRTL